MNLFHPFSEREQKERREESTKAEAIGRN